MTNAMNWFFRETGEIRPALAAGRTADVPWDIASDSEMGTANLIAPSGSASMVTVEKNNVRLGPLPSVGVYRLTTEDVSSSTQRDGDVETDESEIQVDALDPDAEGTLIAVNLSNANESDLTIPELPTSNAGELPPAGRSAWFYLILAACGLVITEWALFQRRVVA
jgi:hypothetical protein